MLQHQAGPSFEPTHNYIYISIFEIFYSDMNVGFIVAKPGLLLVGEGAAQNNGLLSSSS